jgi:nucleotide-binding universal stress UspA family protein
LTGINAGAKSSRDTVMGEFWGLTRAAHCAGLHASQKTPTCLEVRIMKLLVPTDFSPSADAAATLAVSIAKAFDAEVIVLHVLDLAPIMAAWSTPVVAGDQLPPGLAAELLDRMRNEAAVRLLREADRYPRARTLAVEGAPRTTIVDWAKELRADLIVMGTQGRSGLDRVLLGSVAEHVIRHSDVPVLTVRLRHH